MALREIETVFRENGVEVETVIIGNRAIRGCVACGGCAKIGKCVFDDAVNELAPKFEAADGLVVASPVYYASANATLIACLDRLFYSTPFDKTMKVGASGGGRRGGPPDHADAGKEHDVPDAEHRLGEGALWPAGAGGENRHAFYQIIGGRTT